MTKARQLAQSAGLNNAPVQDLTELAALPQAELYDKVRRYVEDEGTDYFYDAEAGSGDVAPDDQVGGVGFWNRYEPTNTGSVNSVNGETGNVVLDPDDLDDTSTDHKFVSQEFLDALQALPGYYAHDATGPANAYVVTGILPLIVVVNIDKIMVLIRVPVENTGASTLKLDNAPAAAITLDGSPLVGGELRTDRPVWLVYSQANGAWEIADIAGSGGTEFADDQFRIKDDSDATKKIAFQASGITTSTTRTITMRDSNVDLDDAATLGSGAASDGQVLTANGAGESAWEAVPGGGALNDLSDVIIFGPSNGQALQYNGSEWVNVTPPSGDFESDGSVAMTGEFVTDVGTFASGVANAVNAVGFLLVGENPLNLTGTYTLKVGDPNGYQFGVRGAFNGSGMYLLNPVTGAKAFEVWYDSGTNVYLNNLAGGQIVIDGTNDLVVPGLPTSDPSVTDALWSDDGIVVLSGSTAKSFYDIRTGFIDVPTTDQVVDTIPIPRELTFPADLAGSVGDIGVNPTSSFVLSIEDDSTEIATATISTGGAFTFATTSGTAKVVAAGSILTFVAPTTVDTTAAQMVMVLVGTV